MTSPESRQLLAYALACGAVVAAAIVLAGCGPTAIQMQARAATVAGVTLGEVGDVLVTARRADLEAVEREHADLGAEAQQAAVDARRLAWRPAFDVLADVQVILAGWIDAIALASAAGGGEDLWGPMLRVAGRLIVAYDRAMDTIGSFAAALHVEGLGDLPRLPEWITALAEGGGE